MFKLKTQFAFFRFNSIVSRGNLPITWFALDDDGEGGRCFTQEELDEFVNYVVNKPNNFPGAKNHHICSEDETPYCGIYTSIPNDSNQYPTKFILRQTPQMSSIVTDCMDVTLTEINGTDRHDYNLSFDVIGQIDC